MSNPSDQLILFDHLPDVHQPTRTSAVVEKAVKPTRKSRATRKSSILSDDINTAVLKPVEQINKAAPLVSTIVLKPNPAPLAPVKPANIAPWPSLVAPSDESYPKQLGQMEAEELRRRNSRAVRLEDRSDEYGKAFLKFAILYLAAKAGIPAYHFVLDRLRWPPMDGTLVSAGIGIACTWHYSQMLTHALLSREHMYQFEIKFDQMSGWGKFAMLLRWSTTTAMLALFVGVAFWTVIDVLSVATYSIEYWHWMRGTTVTSIGR
ncbi:MAG: hypothetical protein K2X41_03295 [Hyphomicrobium sp.]|nr:hypothetical protein [Hyphomicrobium sp.]